MDKYFSFIFSPDIDWHDKDKNMLAGNSLIEQNHDWKPDLKFWGKEWQIKKLYETLEF